MGGEPDACWEEGNILVKRHMGVSCIMTSFWGSEARPDSSRAELQFPACPAAPESSLPAMIYVFSDSQYKPVQDGDCSPETQRGSPLENYISQHALVLGGISLPAVSPSFRFPV